MSEITRAEVCAVAIAEAFRDDGNLKDAPQQAAAETLGENVAEMLAKLG